MEIKKKIAQVMTNPTEADLNNLALILIGLGLAMVGLDMVLP